MRANRLVENLLRLLGMPERMFRNREKWQTNSFRIDFAKRPHSGCGVALEHLQRRELSRSLARSVCASAQSQLSEMRIYPRAT